VLTAGPERKYKNVMRAENFALLVVEDDAFNRNLIVRHLDKEGYGNVETAENGRQALDLMGNTDFDLVLLDIQMPELDGYAVLESMKSDMRLRDVPVIMISAIDEMESVVRCIELGAEDYLPKPFDAVLLRARLGACLEKKRLRDQQKSHLEQIKAEKKRADELLQVILPTAAANELRATGEVKPRRFENVALLFCDIVGFTAFSKERQPEEIVSNLQTLFERFEEITRTHGMEKIKTIGDEYMATAGLLLANTAPLLSAVKCGLDMAAAAHEMEVGWEVRTGVHCGPVVGGIVGHDKYQFDVWGDTVNMAARMAGAGSPGAVAMTVDSWMEVEDDCQGRSLGHLEVKGKGSVEIIECHGLR